MQPVLYNCIYIKVTYRYDRTSTDGVSYLGLAGYAVADI